MKICSQEHQQIPKCYTVMSHTCAGNGIYGRGIEGLSKRWMYPASGGITGFPRNPDLKLFVKLIGSCCFKVCLNVKVGISGKKLQRSREIK